MVWDKLYRRYVIENVFFDEESPYGEDALFNCQAMLKCCRYGRIPYVGYTYDHRNSQMTNGQYNSKGLCNIRVIETMQKLLNGVAMESSDFSKANNTLYMYRINIYRQLFNGMVKSNAYSEIKKDYEYLKGCAKKIPYSILKKNLSIKHRVQWYIYINCLRLLMIKR